MKQASAKVIADSITADGDRLLTMEVVLWRPLLAEFNTHRAFSRNSASTRAIPIERQLARLTESPAYPISWPAEQPGMQGGSELTGQDLLDAQELYRDLYEMVRGRIEKYLEAHPEKSSRLHKSYLARPLETWMWQTIVVSTTDAGFTNFLRQRATRYSKLAQAEIRATADAMDAAAAASTPTLLKAGEWHLPYLQDHERQYPLYVQIPLSVARCARVSYLNHDGVRDLQADFKLFRTLVEAAPPHASPLEHVACPAGEPIWELGVAEPVDYVGGALPLGNFDGWGQLRHNEHALAVVRSLLAGEHCAGAEAFLGGGLPAEVELPEVMPA